MIPLYCPQILDAAHAQSGFDPDAGISRKKQQGICKLSMKTVKTVLNCQLTHKSGNGVALQVIHLIP